jgi:hypothetical protein
MPFTLAHPAAALPLRRPLGKLAVPTALAIGSMTPDLSYVLPWPVAWAYGHSLVGLAGFCLPAGLIAYLASHLLLALVGAALLPDGLRRRCPAEWERGAMPRAAPVAVLVSLLAGAATHVAWDSFTHEDGAMVRRISMLSAPLFTWRGHTLLVCRALQLASSLIGLAVLAAWGLEWYRRTAPRAPSPGLSVAGRAILLAVLLVPGIAVGLAAAWGAPYAGSDAMRRLQIFADYFIFNGGRVFVPGLPIVGAVWRLARTWRSHDD